MSHTVNLAAELGGQVELPDGAVATIEAGALPADIEVTLTRLTCRGVFGTHLYPSCLYEVTGDRELEETRIALTIPLIEEFSSQDTVCAAASSSEGFRCLGDSTTGLKTVAASALKRARFSAQVVSTDSPNEGRSDIESVACGGSVEGKWHMVSTTGTAEQLGGFSYWNTNDRFSQCDPWDRMKTRPFVANERLDFGADEVLSENQNLSWQDYEVRSDRCLQMTGTKCPSDCIKTEGVCECKLHSAGSGGSGSRQSWSYGEAGYLLISDHPQEYCVFGDTLLLQRGRPWPQEVDAEPSAPSGQYLSVYKRATL